MSLFLCALSCHSDAGTGDSGESGNEESRAKSAPSKRKSWIHNRLELKTAEGRPIKVEVPGERGEGSSQYSKEGPRGCEHIFPWMFRCIDNIPLYHGSFEIQWSHYRGFTVFNK